jgi:NADH dehydrogenase FAD-containing subunit
MSKRIVIVGGGVAGMNVVTRLVKGGYNRSNIKD